MCSAEWREGRSHCECGFDAVAHSGLEVERAEWRKRRNISVAIWIVGFGVLLFVPAISTLVAAGIGGMLVSAGFVTGVWSAMHMHSTNRKIRAARTPKQLPAARIV